ncbi:MAG TPA: hypothetical protein VF160_14535, partial [Candidatus Dormibacteraeota bacterium]
PRRARVRARIQRWGPRAVVAAVLVALGLELWLGAQVGTLFQGGFVQDRFALAAKASVLLALAVGVAVADWDLERVPGPLPAALLGAFGVMVAASASDLFAIWVGAALAVAGAAALLGSVRALTLTGTLLMLVALCLAYVHATGGGSALDAVRSALTAAPATLPLALPLLVGIGGLAALLVLAPLGFGAGAEASPFERGAAAALGAAGAGVALLKLAGVLAGAGATWAPGLAGATAALIFLAGVGAALAPRPRLVVGLLAAAQLSWVAAAVATHEPGGLGAGLFLLGAALVAALAATILLGDLELEGALAGLGARSPGRAAALVVAVLSLAALPPLGGFFGVFLVAAALGAAGFWWALTLALVGSILATVGAARIAFAAFLLEEEDTRAPARAPSTRVLPSTFGGAAAVVVTLVLLGYAIFANPISGLAHQAATALLEGR